MDERGKIAGKPVEEVINEAEEKIKNHPIMGHPDDAWILVLASMEKMLELFRGSVSPDQMEDTASQVIAMESILTAFVTEAQEMRLWREAEKAGMSFGSFLEKLEDEQGIHAPGRPKKSERGGRSVE